MKKALAIVTLLFVTILSTGLKPAENHTNTIEYRYYVVQGWEVSTATGERVTQPLVTNITYVDCKYHSASKTELALQDYYKAYYIKKRKADWIDTLIAWKFDTRDKAEQKRREIIAEYNKDDYYQLLYVNNFSVLCDDK